MLSRLLTTIGIQWAGWGIATLMKTEKFYDLTGSATFCYLVFRSISDDHPKNVAQKIQSACVLTWAVRLGSFLFARIIKDGRDRRFDAIKQSHSRFFVAWTLQGVWVFLTLLPSMIMWQKVLQSETLTKRHYIGWTLWLAGFLIESVADYQKWQFRNDESNKVHLFEMEFWLEIVILLSVTFGIQWVSWLIAILMKTEKFYDLVGSATFCAVIILSMIDLDESGETKNAGQIVQAVCVAVWTLRLGIFLFMRVIKQGKDSRFEDIKVSWSKFFVAWTMQGVWIFVTLLPSIFMWTKSAPNNSVGWQEYLGWSIWLIGFLIETIADYQKFCFRNNEANKNTFIRSGLWSISRHPNYFGEILLWFGLFISATSQLSDFEFFLVLCPIFDAVLIVFVSGIPILEKKSKEKWRDNEEYINYVEKTKVLIPFIW